MGTSQVRKFATSSFWIFGLFVFSQLWARGLSVANSLLLAFWFFSNAVIGSWIYLNAIKNKRTNPYEVMFVGSSIGIVLHALLDQLLVGFNIIGMTSRFSILTAIIIILLNRGVLNTEMNPTLNYDTNLSFALFISVMTVLASMDDLSWVTIIVFVFFGLISNLKRLTNFSKWFLISAILISAACQNFLLKMSHGSGRLLLPLITGSDDQIKTEQLSWSLANWGLQTRSSAIDIPIKFHWLSLAWSGSISTGISPQPFSVTLHFVPLVGFLLAAIAGVALAVRISSRPLLWITAPAILILGSGFLERERFYFILTTTNLIPHLFILAFFFLVLNFLEGNATLLNQLLLMLTPSFVMLGKGPYVVAVLLALSALLITPNISIANRFQCAMLLLVSAIFAFATYWIFIRSPYSDGYVFSLKYIVGAFPSPLSYPQTNSGFLRIFVLVFVFTGFLIVRFPMIFLYKKLQLPIHLTRFFICGTASLLFSFIAYQSGSETYFMNAALTLSATANIYLMNCALAGISPSHRSNKARWLLSFFAVLILIGSLIANNRNPVAARFFPFAIQWILLIVVFVLLISWYKSSISLFTISLIIVPLLMGVSGIRLRNSEVDRGPFVKDEIALYEFIRNELPKDAIIGTNRGLCRDTVVCDSDVGMPVAAAFSQRQFLIEGSRSILPTKYWTTNYPFGLQSRVDAIYAFIDAPSIPSKQELLDKGVSWLIIESTNLDMNDYTPNARLVLKSGDFYLLSLNK